MEGAGLGLGEDFGVEGWKIPRRSVIVGLAVERMMTKTQEAAEGEKSPKKAVILQTMLALSNMRRSTYMYICELG